jgi:hypothetical protein
MYHLKKMYKYDRSWATIDGQLWLQFVATGGHSVAQSTPRMSYIVNRPCYDYNFKSYCTRINCIYNHTCIRCGKFHPSVYCPQSFNTFRNSGGYTVRPPKIAHIYSPNMLMESPSVQPAYRNSYAPRARQNFYFRFRPNIAKFPGQQLSLHKMQN